MTEKSLRSFDAVILVTDHDEFDYKQIEDNSKLIIDSRGRYKKKKILLALRTYYRLKDIDNKYEMTKRKYGSSLKLGYSNKLVSGR